MSVAIRPAAPGDVATILRFVRELAAFEREPEAVVATEAMLAAALFGESPTAEAVMAERGGGAVGFALFFHNFSTWTGRRGLYLEDLYVTPAARRHGGWASAARCCATSRRWRWLATARGSSGRCSTGTPTRSPSTGRSGRSGWRNGRCSG